LPILTADRRKGRNVDWISIALYAGIASAAAACAFVSRAARVPGPAVVVCAGLIAGRTGLEWITNDVLQRVFPGVVLHVAVVLTVLGVRLGEGFLRQPARRVVRGVLGPLVLAALSLGAGTVLLPLLLPGAEPHRSFERFFLPLAFVFASFPLLGVRDLRGAPPASPGAHLFVAVGLVGAVHSLTPVLLWSRALEPGQFWRMPVLVLAESGALGVATAVIHRFLVRRLGAPALPALLVLGVLAVEFAFRAELWLPFTGLGLGIALGRMGSRVAPLPAAAFSELPLLLTASLAFAPDLFAESLAGPVLAHTAFLAVVLVVARAVHGRVGRAAGAAVGGEVGAAPSATPWVTGPGFLFLGLTLAVRLDGRMGPLTRYTIDFALPAWIVLRSLVAALERRGRGGRRRAEPAGPSSSPPPS
jgi:hypothetical protein